MNTKYKLPQILKYLRQKHNLTQRQLAKVTGLSLSSIVSYENGLREPNSKAMAALERYFEVSGDYLRGELDRDTFVSNSTNIKGGLESLHQAFKDYSNMFVDGDMTKQVFCTLILENTLHFMMTSILPDDKKNLFNIEHYTRLLESLIKLNHDGQCELIKRADELTEIERYRFLE